MPVLTKAPKAFADAVGKRADRLWNSYKNHGTDGIDSIIAWPLQAIGGAVVGKEKAKDFAWKYVNEPAMRADTVLGGAASKIPLIGGMFKVKEKVHLGGGLYKEVQRPSVMGPATNAVQFATPLIVAHQMNKGLDGLKKIRKQKEESKMKDSHLREKVASAMLHLHDRNREHEKRAHALKVLFKQAELGYVRMPQSYGELEEKLASLVNQDLLVLEKALELAGGNEKLGELGSVDLKSSRSPAEQFQAAILGDEN